MPGLEIRHFEKKTQTQGTAKIKGENPKLKEEIQSFGKFYSNKVENKCQYVCLRKFVNII